MDGGPLLDPGQGDLARGGVVGLGDLADGGQEDRVGGCVVAGEAGLLAAEVVGGEVFGLGEGAGEEASAEGE